MFTNRLYDVIFFRIYTEIELNLDNIIINKTFLLENISL